MAHDLKSEWRMRLSGFDCGNHRKRTGGEAEGGMLVATTVEDSAAVRHSAKSLNPKAAVE